MPVFHILRAYTVLYVTHAHTHACTYAHMQASMHMHARTHTHTSMHMQTHTRIKSIYAYSYAQHTHARTNTCTQYINISTKHLKNMDLTHTHTQLYEAHQIPYFNYTNGFGCIRSLYPDTCVNSQFHSDQGAHQYNFQTDNNQRKTKQWYTHISNKSYLVKSGDFTVQLTSLQGHLSMNEYLNQY